VKIKEMMEKYWVMLTLMSLQKSLVVMAKLLEKQKKSNQHFKEQERLLSQVYLQS